MNKLQELNSLGFTVVEHVFSIEEMDRILEVLSKKNFGKQFGVRYFLKNHPALQELVFTEKLKSLIFKVASNAFMVKSIYFDKPPTANWIVNWHQDTTINVQGRTDEPNYSKWRSTKERTVVQPPLEVLEEMFTIRVHLDDCTVANGALRVVPESHLLGMVVAKEMAKEIKESEVICEVGKGGVLLMKPLILHASKRVENQMNRRVIHLEFSSRELAKRIAWLEKLELN